MAKTPDTVDTFLGDLRSRLTQGGMQEVQRLRQLKIQDCASRGELFDGSFFSWDLTFYNRLMLETQYLVDQKNISEYFPLQTTIKGMLEIFQNLFGLIFLKITNDERNKLANSGKGSDLAWHDDVQVFSVWDDEGQGSEFVGYLYLDLFHREGKYGQAANFNLWPVCSSFNFFFLDLR
jgi:metallopeptidase MepB